MEKKVIKFKGNTQTEEMCGSDGVNLFPAVISIEPHWLEIIKDVFNYQMRRDASLQEVHKLFTDDKILLGLKLYKEGKVREGAITDVDVRANVEGETKDYMVTMKKWLPLNNQNQVTLVRHRYEIEEYIADMFFDCSCEDHMMGHYKANSSVACKHICAVMWKLMKEHNMPKFFIEQIEKEKGWTKSSNVDLVKELYGLPMKQFSTFLNVLVLRDYQGIPTSLSLSIHRNPNKGYENLYPEGIKPIWMTLTEPSDVEKLIKGIINGYSEMLFSRKNSNEQIQKAIQNIIPNKQDDELQNKINEFTTKNRKLEEEIKILKEKSEFKDIKIKSLINKDELKDIKKDINVNIFIK